MEVPVLAWIELHQSVWSHRKTLLLADALEIDPIYAAAHMIHLWTWALDNAQDGDLSGLPPRVIAAGAGWPGDPERFVAAVVAAGFLDQVGDSLLLHDWHDYAGRLMEQRRLNAERNKRKRQLYDDPVLTSAVRQRDGDTCRYCGKTVNWRDRKSPTGGTYDHVDPDGPNTVENVVVACRGCNSRKGRRTPEEAGMILLPPRTPAGHLSGSARDLPEIYRQSALKSAYHTKPNQEDTAAADNAPARATEPAAASPGEAQAREQTLELINRHFPKWAVSGRPYELLLSYADDLGWDLLLIAVQRTLGAGKTDIRYCIGILKRWDEAGIRTVEDMEVHEARSRAEREQTNPQRRARSPTREPPREVHPIDEFDWTGFDDCDNG